MKKNNKLLIGLGAALAAVAAIFWVRQARKEQGDRPPKKAPQLPIENPGEQSEFTTSASESQVG